MSGIYPYLIDPYLAEEYDRIKTEVELDPDYNSWPPVIDDEQEKKKIRL